jgi:peptidyl-prolyl cis-trans isomerase C
MLRLSSIVAPLVLCLGVMTMAPALAADAKPKDANPVVAKVEGQEIRLAEVIDAFSRVPPQYQTLPAHTLFAAVLDNLINVRVAAAAARKAKLNELPEVKEQMARVEAEILQQVYLSKAVDEQLTEEAVRKRYDEVAKNVQGEEQVIARHILVDNEAQAKDVIAQLGRSGNFVELARKYSKGPTASTGGDLGYFSRDGMVPEFSKAAFALKDGEYTKIPVKTPIGWHVIKVEGRRVAGPPSFEELRDKLEADMVQELSAKVMEGLKRSSKIERFEVDPAAVDAMLRQ